MIQVKKIKMGRPIAKKLCPPFTNKDIDVGYGPGQLRPDQARQPETEYRQLSIVNSKRYLYPDC